MSEAVAFTVTLLEPVKEPFVGSVMATAGGVVSHVGVGGGLNAALTWNVQHFLWSAPGWRSETHAVAVQLPSPE